MFKSPSEANTVIREINKAHGASLPEYPALPNKQIPATPVSSKGIQMSNPLTPKPTLKGAKITVEKGKIGIAYSKTDKTPPVAQKPTVASTIGEPKADTFKRFTELDTNPEFTKLNTTEVLGGSRVRD